MALVFSFASRFSITVQPQEAAFLVHYLDSLSPSTRVQELCASPPALDTPAQRRVALCKLLPRVVAHAPLHVNAAPTGPDDAHFWQYPAITEKQAWQNMSAAAQEADCALQQVVVHSYLGLPWATCIDKLLRPADARGQALPLPVPPAVHAMFAMRIRGYRQLAEHWGFVWGTDVRLHTVCQHIEWARLLPYWAELGFTDVHLPHLEPDSQTQAASFGLQLHPWPLAAANVVNDERSHGLFPVRPWQQRALLASFVGADLPNCRADTRRSLAHELQQNAAPDVLLSLSAGWHYDPVVYGYQVANLAPSQAELVGEQQATLRYNQVLADSVFALCPEGAGPNTIRLWEALAAGSIPVVIVEDWVWPSLPGWDAEALWSQAVLHVRRADVPGLLPRLRRMRDGDPALLTRMQARCLELYEAFAASRCF